MWISASALIALLAVTAGSALAARDLNVTIAGPLTGTDNQTLSYNFSTVNSGTGAGSNVEIQAFLDGNASATLHDFGNLADGEGGSAIENYTLACGIHVVNATVDPSDGVPETNESNNNASLTVVVTPFANFSTVVGGALGALSYTFNASSSHGCSALNYTWTIGGQTYYGLNVSVSPDAGNLTVALAVRGNNNSLLTGYASATIAVPNAPPSLVLNPSTNFSRVLGTPLNLVITAEDSDGSIASTFVSFGDGNNTTDPAQAMTYAYQQPGFFTVVVRVVDNLGANNTSTVVVSMPAPFVCNLCIGSDARVSGRAGEPVTFAITPASPPFNGTLTITWDYGDGTTGASPNHTYTAAGNYTATVTVTDSDGNTAQQAIQVSVDPQPQTSQPQPGGLPPWLWWLLLLIILGVILLIILGRRRKDEPAKTDAAPGSSPPAPGSSDTPAAPKPPSP